MPFDVDSVVVGAGVVGLAIARALAETGRDVLVLERHRQCGEETSSRNSEVIHAGIYYPQGSLKARLCVAGRERLYRYCESHGVEHQRLGKLIVATDESQIDALTALHERARRNGVDDCRLLDAAELQALEPSLSACRALLSPSTGIINSHELMLAYQGDLERAGGTLVLDAPVTGGRVIDGGFSIDVGSDMPSELRCRELINSAGLGAQALSASIAGIPPASIPQRYLSRGCYFQMQGRAPFRHLIYPMPNDVGLGVHLTLDLQGRARFGPDTEWIDAIDYAVDPTRADAFYDAIRTYFPQLADGALQPAYAGIRPKIAAPGEAPADFCVTGPAEHGVSGWVALYGIESPGLTASMAIADVVVASLADRHATASPGH